MRGIAAPVAASVLLAASACAAAQQCASGLYIIVARGSGEPKGAGVTGTLAESIGEKIKDSQVVPLDYPATLSNPNYNVSEGAGVRAMQSAIKNYTESCPDSKLAIMGYSQGAQLSADVLCGTTGDGFEDAKPLAMDTAKDNIVAVVLFGDPTHIANTTYDRGTSVNDGFYKRNATSASVCQGYAGRMVSYCDTGDVFCDSGDNMTVHLSYVPRYGDEVVQYVVDKYKDATEKSERTEKSAATDTATTMSASAMADSTTSPSASTTTSADSSGTPVDPGGNRGHVSAASGPLARRNGFLGSALVVTAVLQAL